MVILFHMKTTLLVKIFKPVDLQEFENHLFMKFHFSWNHSTFSDVTVVISLKWNSMQKLRMKIAHWMNLLHNRIFKKLFSQNLFEIFNCQSPLRCLIFIKEHQYKNINPLALIALIRCSTEKAGALYFWTSKFWLLWYLLLSY